MYKGREKLRGFHLATVSFLVRDDRKNISEKVSTTYVAPTGHCTIYMMTEKNRREKDPLPTSSRALKRGGEIKLVIIVHALK